MAEVAVYKVLLETVGGEIAYGAEPGAPFWRESIWDRDGDVVPVYTQSVSEAS